MSACASKPNIPQGMDKAKKNSSRQAYDISEIKKEPGTSKA
jgi:hypothetical protein